MEMTPTPSGELILVLPEHFGDDLTPEAIEKWATGRFDEDGDFIETYKPPSSNPEAGDRLKELQIISKRQMAFYESMKQAGLSPDENMQFTLDNLTNPFSHKCADVNKKLDHPIVVRRAHKILAKYEGELAVHLRQEQFGADMRAGKIPGPVMPKYDPYQEEAMPVTAKREPLRVVSASSFAGRVAPEREELVRGLIPAKIIGGLYGDGAVGKSLLAMMLGTAVASGTLWLNRFVQKGPVVYVCCEDDEDEVHRRLENICREMRVNMASLSDFHIVPLADEESVLAAADGRSSVLTATPLFNQLVELTADVKPRLFIGDTLNDIFAGSEIDRMQAKQFVKLMRKLVIPHGGTGLILAHPSVDGMRSGNGTSGSTGWNNSFRWRGYLDKVLDDSGHERDITRRVLKTKKLNYGPQGGEIELLYQNGCYVTAESGPVADPMFKQRRADRVFVDLLRKAIAQNNNVSTAINSGLYAPKVFRIDADKQNVTFPELREAMGRLLDSHIIENAPHGARSKNQFRLYVAPE